MPTAAEVRQRVEQADAARIQRRADAAATVAELHAAREEAAARLAEADKQLADSVATAEQHMTRKELAEFIGAKTGEIDQWASNGSRRTGKRRSTRKRSSSNSATTSAAPSGTNGVEVSTAEPEHSPTASSEPDSASTSLTG